MPDLQEWTDTDLDMSWEFGRYYERELIARALDDIAHSEIRWLPQLTHEQRVQQRIAEMEKLAITNHPGGPVAPW